MKALQSIRANRNLTRLLLAQVPADFSDWLDFIAIGAILAFSWNAEPIAFAWLAVAMGLPYLIVGVPAGAIVDKSDLKTVLVLSNLARGGVTFALIFANSVPLLLAFVFLRSMADSFFSPAKQAAIQALTDDDDLMQANAVSHTINQVSKIAGPVVGGAMLAYMAPQSVFLFNTIISLTAAVILLGLPKGFRELVPSEPSTILADIREALTYLRHNRILTITMLLMGAGFFSMFFYDTMFPLLTAALSFDQTAFGLAIACVGLGGTLSAILLISISLPRPFLAIGLGSLVAGICIALLGVFASTEFPLHEIAFYGIFLLIGMMSSFMFVPFRTIMQHHTKPEMMARVAALSEMISILAMLIAPFIGATIALIYTVGVSFIIGGIMGALLGLVAIIISFKLANDEPK